MMANVFRSCAAVVASGVVLAAGLAGGASAAKAGPALPPGWTHISVNISRKGVGYTLVYDRGRVIAVTATSLTLRERDGSVWVINVSPTAQITIAGQSASLSQVRRFENATTLSVNGTATKVTVRIPPALAAAIARQQGGA
jgi:hypothetical protein